MMASTQILPGGEDNHHHPAAGNDTRLSDSNEISSPSQDLTHCGAQSSAVHVTTDAVGVVPSGGPCLATAYGTVVWPASLGLRATTELMITSAKAPGDPPSCVVADGGGCHQGGKCDQDPAGAMAPEESFEECGETVVSLLCVCLSKMEQMICFVILCIKNSGAVLNDRRQPRTLLLLILYRRYRYRNKYSDILL